LKIESRPYLHNGSTDLREILCDDVQWDSEADRKLKFATFKNPKSGIIAGCAISICLHAG